MNKLHTFDTVDGRFTMTVKSEFLTRCPNPETLTVYELMTKHKINIYFHNPKGPANIRKKDGYVEYWLDGQVLSKEEGAKIAHNHQFTEKLQDVINDTE